MADIAIEDSDDRKPDGASPKVARAAGGRPTKRTGAGSAVTLEDLQSLLQQQSDTLARSQAREIRAAVTELREATTAELRGIRTELTRHSDYISQLRDQGEKLEARVQALEAQKTDGSTACFGSASGEGGHQKNLVILGGWDADTHKSDLLPELKELLGRIGVLGPLRGYLHYRPEARACDGASKVAGGPKRPRAEAPDHQVGPGHPWCRNGRQNHASW